MTQLELAKEKKSTPLMQELSQIEKIELSKLMEGIANGKIVIPANKNHKLKKPCAIGCGLRTKVNANVGTSTDKVELEEEIEKIKIAQKFGADTVMDLSVGGNLKLIRRRLIEESQVPFGTVPIYEAAVNAEQKDGSFIKMTKEDIFKVLQSQAKDGVDFFTIHCGITLEVVDLLNKNKRVLGIVSRGGAILVHWMKSNHKENPLFEYFDELLTLAKEYDVTLSLGDGMRPGSIIDSTDALQIKELSLLGDLAKKAREKGVQVMIEGPGHLPLNEIEANVLLAKKLCAGAPFYVLGPLVTDVAPGYDHITSAIGGALAASYGADFLCYVTPAEHLRHPDSIDVREGVIASRIAAHAADIVKGIKGALSWDEEISLARKKRDWKKQIQLSIDPQKAKAYRNSSPPEKEDVCTMCGKYCSLKLIEECLG